MLKLNRVSHNLLDYQDYLSDSSCSLTCQCGLCSLLCACFLTRLTFCSSPGSSCGIIVVGRLGKGEEKALFVRVWFP